MIIASLMVKQYIFFGQTHFPSYVNQLAVMALSKHPFLNSCFNKEYLKITLKGSHNKGVAMATEHGLVFPYIKNAQSLSLLEITKEQSRLRHLATNNRLSLEDVIGGTVTLSNVGAIGRKFGSPLLNLLEVAIIALGRIEKVPKLSKDGTVYPASIMLVKLNHQVHHFKCLSLIMMSGLISVNIAADHRVLDGAAVPQFCCQWKEYIEKPELLMLQMR